MIIRNRLIEAKKIYLPSKFQLKMHFVLLDIKPSKGAFLVIHLSISLSMPSIITVFLLCCLIQKACKDWYEI